MKFVEVLKECESAGGAGSKKVIQAALGKLDADGRRLMRYALDPYTVFGVKKYDPPARYAGGDSSIDPFFELLDDLSARRITGNQARQCVTAGLSLFTPETAAYLARVLDKDPKAGFSADTFNKIWPNDPIPSWDQQLAEVCEDEEAFEERITFPCRADIKYDGNRAFAFVKEGQVNYFARGGKPSDHLSGIFDEELQAVWKEYGQDFVMDGEVLATSFTETQNAKKKGNDGAKKALVFRAFFIMPMVDWIAKKTAVTNRMALDQLTVLLSGKVRVQVSVGKIVHNYKEMVEYCNSVIDDETKTKAEREGLILKQLDAVYEWGRSFAWIKVKRFYDVDARFLSFYEARKGTKRAKLGYAGGANCVAFLESGERVEFRVGSGFSYPDLESIRDNPEEWLKKTHVIKYQEVSRAKNKPVASLRFCTYERSRDDKLVEI